MPNLTEVLPAKLWKTSGVNAVLESEQVLPLVAIGIVTELLTMFPLTITKET